MSAAVETQIMGDEEKAALIQFACRNNGANGLRIWHWLNPAWSLDVDDGKHVIDPNPRGDTSRVPKDRRDGKSSTIPADVKRAVLSRDGYRCRYCGIPVVDAEIRKIANKLHPESVTWGGDPRYQHAGFAVMWLQYDHVVPWSHGGRTDKDNVVIACALCNFGKWNNTLKQLGLEDPRNRAPDKRNDYDGLERLRPMK